MGVLRRIKAYWPILVVALFNLFFGLLAATRGHLVEMIYTPWDPDLWRMWGGMLAAAGLIEIVAIARAQNRWIIRFASSAGIVLKMGRGLLLLAVSPQFYNGVATASVWLALAIGGWTAYQYHVVLRYLNGGIR